MAALNRGAAAAMQEAGASACTDITGFGLFAHLRRMLRPGGCGAEIFAGALPAFAGALEALRQGVIPGAIERNREYVGDALHTTPDVDEAAVNLGFDAQTSGGLLIAVPPARLEMLRQSLARRGAGHFVIGKITAGQAGQIFLSTAGETPESNPTHQTEETDPMNTPNPKTPAPHDGCCAEMFESAGGSAAETQKAFGALMKSVQAAGVLDEKTKELILFSLVVASRCQPCLEAHVRKARALGLPQAALDEAAWCAIAMGGAPVKMFYQENMERLKAKAGEA
jgi:AhpD family alkylhydroperoxidase